MANNQCLIIGFIYISIITYANCSPPYVYSPLSGIGNRFNRELDNIIAHKSLKHAAHLPGMPARPKDVPDWPRKQLNVGQVSGVAVNSKNQPVIFHRADHVWDADAFDGNDNYLQRERGPITENTVLVLDPETGEILHSWGANLFYMPHGITIDSHDNLWVTDVALHQAFKFKFGDSQPLLEFGFPFTPGDSFEHLCKPTSIAVATTGEIFIADGYCNQRVLKFNAAGGLLRIIPNPPESLPLSVPHGLALFEKLDRICIADREHRRVVCPRAGLYVTEEDIMNREIDHSPWVIDKPVLGRMYDIAPIGNFIYGVGGMMEGIDNIYGYTMDPATGAVIDRWYPTNDKFYNPHAMAVSPNRTALYVTEIGPNRLWKFDLLK
ncbi:peptidyl-alpha-hydroxyglycine alpha-amidating lyase 2-like [Chrysoperla carnea]|uniref:peptidyl-alpha-hydroxyglycine alpha-amidating lyase 2-like n=1 Tax=Chrysoperla carnea TaxID=189513 RepID=UPI001D072C4E|nr:peptidyl-alpha-hydroxyglycine alpha-amidating lyase 2-like [Chrysoperla carnea]